MKQQLKRLPEGWKWVELEKISKIFAGSPAPQDKKYFINAKNPFVRVSDLSLHKITDNLINVRDCLTDECVKKEKLILAKKGTLIFPKSGAAIATNNRALLGIDAYIVSHLAAVKPMENNILSKWLYYYFLTLNMVFYCDNPSYPSLQLSTIKKIPILLPPLEIQKQIVEKLDLQMAQVEIMKKETEKEKKASEMFYDSILKSVLNKPSFKKDKIKNLCKVNPRRPDFKYSDDTDTSFIPMEAVNQYKGMIDNLQVKPFGKIKKGYTYFEENDILFAKITPCMQNKKSAIANNLVNGFGFGTTEFHVLRANQKIMAGLLFYYVREGNFVEKAKLHFTGAVGQQRVPKEFIEEYEISYPENKQEQIKLLNLIKKYNAEIHKINELISQKLNAISLLPSSLLNEVFGKYEIPETIGVNNNGK